jgi:hypothetical protein
LLYLVAAGFHVFRIALRSSSFPMQIDARDLPRVGDVLQRIGVEHGEGGALACRHRAELYLSMGAANLTGTIVRLNRDA